MLDYVANIIEDLTLILIELTLIMPEINQKIIRKLLTNTRQLGIMLIYVTNIIENLTSILIEFKN